MKKKVLVGFVILVCIFSTSCELKDELSQVNLLSETDTITDLVTATSWKVSLFINKGLDETANLNGYSFAFNTDGSLFADSTTDSVEGTWEIIEKSSDTTEVTGTNTQQENDVDETTVADNGNDTDGADNSVVETVNSGNNESGPDNGDDANEGNDTDCDNCANQQLFEILRGCSDWFVDKLERNDEDLDDRFSNYRFDFLEDGTLTAKTGSNSYSGSWEISGNVHNTRMTIDIPTLDEVNDTWNLHEIELESDERKVDLRIGGDDRLRFKNRCSTLADKTLASVNKAGNNPIFRIFFANVTNFSRLSRDWEIITRTDIKIVLVHVDKASGVVDQLEFERN